MKRSAISLLLLIIFIIGSFAYLYFTYPHTNVLKSSTYFMEHMLRPHANLNKHVIGFLPYWRIDDIKYIKPELLSEINYFGLHVGNDGALLKITNGETDPGWLQWNSENMRDFITKTKIHGTEFSITIICQKNETIEAILDSQAAQETLTAEVIDLIEKNHLDSINIDFEYLGDVDETYKHKFTELAKLLHDEVKKETPKAKLSLSIMPRAARSNDLFDFPAIAPYFDRFIGMSYDYYGINADVSGPGAPMRGFKENKFFFDVETTYEDYRKVLPKEKIIMGVPYYGWDRAVIDGSTVMSKTYQPSDERNYAAVTSYGRLRDEVDFKPTKCTWDDYSQSSWCKYTKDDVDHQVWIEDEKSLGIKYDFAKKNDFAGIAIWTLGFDKNYPDLWNLIKEKFGTD